MKKLILVVALFCSAVPSHAQNWATVSGSNITDLNQRPLAAGQICFLVTDQNDRPISVSIGGGGQTLRRPYCSAVSNGAITAFTVPNPATTLPSGIYYRVTVKDTTTGQEVLRYSQVTFAGATFNFDTYTPVNLGSFAPLSGTSVSGNLSVAGDGAFTGTVTGSNIPGLIPGTGSCANQFVTALNASASPTCTADMLASAQHANQGTATTVLHGNVAGNPSWAAVSPSDTTGTNGSGNFVLATSPTLTTPNIGAATATSVTSNGTDLTLSETGDVSAESRIVVQNRTGLDGAAIEDPGIALADLGLRTTASITNVAITSNVLTVTAAFAPMRSTELPSVGQTVTLSGLTAATFLNNQTVTIATITTSQFTASFTHADYASAPDTGTAIVGMNVRGEFRNDIVEAGNVTGEFEILDPSDALTKWFFAGKAVVGVSDAAVFQASSIQASGITTSGTETAAAFVPSTHGSVIQNSDFEGSSIIPPPGWGISGVATLSYETTNPSPGKTQSIRVDTAAQFSSIASLTRIAVKPGDIYTATCEGKADGSSNASCQVDCEGPSGLTGQFFGSASVTTSWGTGTVRFTVPANSQWCRVDGENPSATQPSTVWFDRFQIQKDNFDGVKHQRWTAGICTTAASAGSTCIFNESWSSPFADANYTPVCTMSGPSNGTAQWALNGWTASSVQIILASTGLASTYVGLDCIAFHD